MVRRDTDYAMRALVYLAEHPDEGAVSVKTLADLGDIPIDYAYKVMRKLSEANITNSYMGAKGGFILGRAPENITLLDVIDAIQGPVCVSNCVINPGVCHRRPTCRVSPRWGRIQKSIMDLLNQTTLANIINGEESF